MGIFVGQFKSVSVSDAELALLSNTKFTRCNHKIGMCNMKSYFESFIQIIERVLRVDKHIVYTVELFTTVCEKLHRYRLLTSCQNLL